MSVLTTSKRIDARKCNDWTLCLCAQVGRVVVLIRLSEQSMERRRNAKTTKAATANHQAAVVKSEKQGQSTSREVT